MRQVLLIFLMLAIATYGGTALAGSVAKFSSLSVTLPPGDDTFPPGPNVEVMNNNCLACHSREMVLYQPRMSRSEWAKEVDKMRRVYKAPIDDADVAAIVGYLASARATR